MHPSVCVPTRRRPRARQACSRCGVTKTPKLRTKWCGAEALCNACGMRLDRLLSKARVGGSLAPARAATAPAAGALPGHLPTGGLACASCARARSLPSELRDDDAACADCMAAARSARLPHGKHLLPPMLRKRSWADLGGGRPSPAGDAWAAQHAAEVAALHEQPALEWPPPPPPALGAPGRPWGTPLCGVPQAAPAAGPDGDAARLLSWLSRAVPPPLCLDDPHAPDSATTPLGHPGPPTPRRADARQAARHSLGPRAAPALGRTPPLGHLQIEPLSIETPLSLDPEPLSAMDLRMDDLAFLRDLTGDCGRDGVRPAASPAWRVARTCAWATLPRLQTGPAERCCLAARHCVQGSPVCVCAPPMPWAGCAAAPRCANAGRGV